MAPDALLQLGTCARQAGPAAGKLRHAWRSHRAVPDLGRIARGADRARQHGLRVRSEGGLVERLRSHYAKLNPDRIGVAVSGGSDSLALLHAARAWGVVVEAVTVDHGLRPEAAEEAAYVAEVCRGLGVPHSVLRWEGWDGRGNLQDQARQNRYALIAGWAEARRLRSVALGHTMDDQAETLLMRLAREAGVEGLVVHAARLREGRGALRPAVPVRPPGRSAGLPHVARECAGSRTRRTRTKASGVSGRGARWRRWRRLGIEAEALSGWR